MSRSTASTQTRTKGGKKHDKRSAKPVVMIQKPTVRVVLLIKNTLDFIIIDKIFPFVNILPALYQGLSAQSGETLNLHGYSVSYEEIGKAVTLLPKFS